MKIKKESAMGGNDELNARIKSRMDAMNKRLADRMAALDARLVGTPLLLGEGKAAAIASSRESHTNSLTARADVVGIDNVFADFFQPSLVEMSQLFEYVRKAPVVQDNKIYAAIMNSAQFAYNADPDNRSHDVVNADAGLADNVPVIRVFGGAARIGRVASLSIAAMKYGNDEGAARRFIATLRPTQCGSFSIQDAIQVVNDAKLAGALGNDSVVTNAKSISAGLMLGIIAHEAGHLSLGHSFSEANYYETNLEVARNREREADSFSSSVIASSPFGESILEGTLLWWYVLSSQEGDGAKESTHPLSRERFENMVRANKGLAKSLGIELPGE